MAPPHRASRPSAVYAEAPSTPTGRDDRVRLRIPQSAAMCPEGIDEGLDITSHLHVRMNQSSEPLEEVRVVDDLHDLTLPPLCGQQHISEIGCPSATAAWRTWALLSMSRPWSILRTAHGTAAGGSTSRHVASSRSAP